MKKLMVAVAAVALALTSQAYTYNWSVSGTLLDGTGGASKYTGTGYLIDAGVHSQTDVLRAFVGGGFDMADWAIKDATTSALATSAFNAGASTASADFSYGGTTPGFQAFFAVVNGDNIYISSDIPTGYQTAAAQPISFDNPMMSSYAVPTEVTTTDSWSGNHWYTAAAIPEPTSGLLLLLGVAGLALKRKLT